MLFSDITTMETTRVQRVRGMLLTSDNKILFIKRVKPNRAPYWVAPGGGVEECDDTLAAALHRECYEELGATIRIIQHEFVLHHEKAGKRLEEHFYLCRLVDYDLSLQHGPEFDDPARGKYIPHAVPLRRAAIAPLNIITTSLKTWLLTHLPELRELAGRD